MRLTLGLTGLWDRFAGSIFSADEVRRGEPAPDLFLYAASRMSTPPERCVVIEDSPFGIAAAKAAGAPAPAPMTGQPWCGPAWRKPRRCRSPLSSRRRSAAALRHLARREAGAPRSAWRKSSLT